MEEAQWLTKWGKEISAAVAFVFGVGAGYQRLKSKIVLQDKLIVQQNEMLAEQRDDIEKLESEFDRKLLAMAKEFKSQMDEVMAYVVDPKTKLPRFVTIQMHNDQQSGCQSRVDDKIESYVEHFRSEIRHVWAGIADKIKAVDNKVENVGESCQRIEENMERRNPARVSLENCDKN